MQTYGRKINGMGIIQWCLFILAAGALGDMLTGWRSLAAETDIPVLTDGNRETADYSLIMTNGYGDMYRMNMMRERVNYEAYRGVCSYRGFSLSGCSTTGEVVMMRIKATSSMPEHFSIVSTSLRWGSTMYFLNDVFRPLNSFVMAGYENWYPFDMSCSVAMYLHGGGFASADPEGPEPIVPEGPSVMSLGGRYADDADLREWGFFDDDPPATDRAPAAGYTLVMTNGYGDRYRMNMMRERVNYQAYRGVCSYRGFSLSGCSTTGEVVMLRIKATPSMPEHYSLLSTSKRWGTTMYVLNDVFRSINSNTLAGYENWYPFDMSCSVAFYIESGGLGSDGSERPQLSPDLQEFDRSTARDREPMGDGVHRIGALIPLSGDASAIGADMLTAYQLALAEVTNTPGMGPVELIVRDTRADPFVALDHLMDLYDQGVQVVLGPETSAECAALVDYANRDDKMLLLSSASTAVPLAVADDNLMRLSADDRYQAAYLADTMLGEGITELAVFTRSDMYGTGFRDAFLTAYTNAGGNVFVAEYLPRASMLFSDVVEHIDEAVATRCATVDPDNVGVLAVVFGEGEILLQEAARFPGLMSVRWYGTEAMAGNPGVLTNPDALQAARDTRYVCSQLASHTNAHYATVHEAIQQANGYPPSPFGVQAYDAFWVTALALNDPQATGTVATLRQAIIDQAATYAGATGPIRFNAAGDRDQGRYASVRVTASNEWMAIDKVAPEAPMARDADDQTVVGFTARWSAPPGATHYFMDVVAGTNFSDDALLPGLNHAAVGSVRRYAVTGLTPGDTYSYRVRAANAAGTSAWSAPVAVDVPTHSTIHVSVSDDRGGSIDPAGPVMVAPYSNVTFVVSASNYFTIGAMTTNAVAIDGAAGTLVYTHRWDNIIADGILAGIFDPQTAASNTPLWWLAQFHELDEVADLDALALSDTDGDGMKDWQEYVAGTSPVDRNDVFAMKALAAGAVQDQVVFSWASIPDRLYSMDILRHPVFPLPGNEWDRDSLYTRVPGTGQWMSYTSTLPASVSNGWFRLTVEIDDSPE